MKIFKIWCVACTIFCLYNLNMLFKESYEVVNNIAENQHEAEPSILACKELSFFALKEVEFEMSQLKFDLYNHFNRSKDYDLFRMGVFRSDFKSLILNPIETASYQIFNGMLCFPTKDENERFFITLFLRNTKFFAFKKGTDSFAEMNVLDRLDQLIVLKKGHPYSGCTKNNVRFSCLNACFKSGFRLSRYFYDGSEAATIRLNSSTNRSVEENEKSCFGKCPNENCKMVQLNLFPSIDNRKSQTTTLKNCPILSGFDYWVQLIGLLCSFANISLNKLASILIKFASLSVRRKKLRICLSCLKWAITILSMVYCGYLYTTMILDYKAEERNPVRKEITRNFIKQRAIHLVICLDIREYLHPNFEFFDIHALDKTMPEIERAAERVFDDTVEGVFMNYQNKLFRTDYNIEKKVLFKNTRNKLCKCFSLFVRPDYQMLSSKPKLAVKFKHYNRLLKFYLLAENEQLNEKTFEPNDRIAFMKKTAKRLKSGGRCIDYDEKYKNCSSRLNCVERCVVRKFFEKFGGIPFGDPESLLVDRDDFRREEWRTAKLIRIPNDDSYAEIEKRCSEVISDEKPCVEIHFQKTNEAIQPDGRTKEIDLFLDVELSIEELSWFKLLLNIMSIQNIFFSLTVLKLLKMAYSFIKPKLRIRQDKTVLFLSYLICSLGFFWHTYRIFYLSINEELTYSQFYEKAEQAQMPVLLFCHPIDEKSIDRNHKLTGSYLDQLTSDMAAESVFTNITYLSESNDWATFDLSLVERFFFMNLKCFRVRINQVYHKDRFYFSANSQALNVLKVNFTNRFMDEGKMNQIVYFMTKSNETTAFSNIVSLFYDFDYFRKRYSADQSELKVVYQDHLSFIKRYLSTVYEDEFNDLDGQLLKMRNNQYDFGTLKNPVEKGDFDVELRDDLFDQFFIQVQNVTTRGSLDSLNHQQTFLVNHLRKSVGSHSDFTFSLILIKKIQLTRNGAKLGLGLLNVLFWLDLSILDLHLIFVYLRCYPARLSVRLFGLITRILLFISKCLKKLESPLYEFLSPHKTDSP